jgi:hypothetical protein
MEKNGGDNLQPRRLLWMVEVWAMRRLILEAAWIWL